MKLVMPIGCYCFLAPLRVQQGAPPRLLYLLECQALVKPEGALLPKFQVARQEQESRPARGTGHRSPLEPARDLFHSSFHGLTIVEGRGLSGRMGSQLAPSRPPGKVGVRGPIVHLPHRAANANLTGQALPVEEKRCSRMVRELPRLGAFEVRVEHEALPSQAPHQHGSDVGIALFVNRCQLRSGGVIGFGSRRLLGPP